MEEVQFAEAPSGLNKNSIIIKLIIAFLAMIIAFRFFYYKDNNTEYKIIPQPYKIEYPKTQRPFILNPQTSICYPSNKTNIYPIAASLIKYIGDQTNMYLTGYSGVDESCSIILDYKEQNDDESYNLTIDHKRIIINGSSPSGLFYGVQTLRKMTPVAQKMSLNYIPVSIIDKPKFSYRGMLLDVSRHFFPVSDVKNLLDLLALHNINYFHWHLTDDPGWRIQIKKYPLLTELGSKRDTKDEGSNGYYTQEEIKEIIEYAKERFIHVIPEIDMPGHISSLLTGYPDLGCTGGPYQVGTKWQVYKDILCAGNPKSYEMMKDILEEVMNLFPSKYVHIGGDEAPKGRWHSCKKCQKKIEELGLKDKNGMSKENQLQRYFMAEMGKFIRSKGKIMIAWDEVIDGGFVENATITAWQDETRAVLAAKMNYTVIQGHRMKLYFDYKQTIDVDPDGLQIGNYLPVEHVYNFDPIPDQLTDEEKKRIIGVQGCLWTEHISNFKRLMYQALPRTAALAELQWSHSKNYKSFIEALKKISSIYDLYKWRYCVNLT